MTAPVLTAEERATLHEFHANTINPDWRTCPLCPPLASAVKAIVTARLTAAEARATALAADEPMTAVPGEAGGGGQSE